MVENMAEYRDVYSSDALWRKLRRFGRQAGRQVVEKAVLLYLVLRDPATPVWAKTTVLGALGYLIAPIDAIPDLLPGVGFSDDLGVLLVAATTVAASITPAMEERARRVAGRLFGSRQRPADAAVIEASATTIRREQH